MGFAWVQTKNLKLSSLQIHIFHVAERRRIALGAFQQTSKPAKIQTDWCDNLTGGSTKLVNVESRQRCLQSV